MPTYDYRCKDCGTAFSLFYKTYADYDAAAKVCPRCGSTALARVITRVALAKPTHNYAGMSSGEMLGVLDSGDSRAVGELFKQVGDAAGGGEAIGADYAHATERLLRGDSMASVERDLSAGGAPSGDVPAAAPAPPKAP